MKILRSVTQAKDWVQPLDLNLRTVQAILLCLKIVYVMKHSSYQEDSRTEELCSYT
jgi:hypothetical protein